MNEENNASFNDSLRTISPDQMLKSLVLQRRSEFIDVLQQEGEREMRGIQVRWAKSRAYLMSLYREIKQGYLFNGNEDLEDDITAAASQRELGLLFDQIDAYMWSVGLTKYVQEKRSGPSGVMVRE